MHVVKQENILLDIAVRAVTQHWSCIGQVSSTQKSYFIRYTNKIVTEIYGGFSLTDSTLLLVIMNRNQSFMCKMWVNHYTYTVSKNHFSLEKK